MALSVMEDPQDIAPAAWCERCGGEVYPGERRFLWEGRWVCPDCLTAVVEQMLRDFPETLALEMGLEVERYA